ncbi:MAG: MBL fold metallo-hydrolase [Desulfovermiculus sp.]|nr:MBL fold metallo-hydrolase [Desulfovermiculus sp.]
MLVKQLEVGNMDNFCYIVACPKTNKAAIIDPGADKGRILNYINEHSLTVEYILATHFHFDHTEVAPSLRQETGARLAMHEADIAYYQQEVDVVLHDGDIIRIGDTVRLDVLHTRDIPPAGSVSMEKASSLPATPSLWAIAAAPTCPMGIDPPWVRQSADSCCCRKIR